MQFLNQHSIGQVINSYSIINQLVMREIFSSICITFDPILIPEGLVSIRVSDYRISDIVFKQILILEFLRVTRTR